MPVCGYGLYMIPAGESEAATLKALEVGYRHLDSASFYANEAGVGRAIAQSGIPRQELFVASKVWTDCIGLGAAAVRSSIDRSLAELQVEYLDLAYVHWPVPGKHVEAYETLESMVAEGKVRAIGLSNYRIEDFEELMAREESSGTPKKVSPAVNQIEVNPFLYRKPTIEFFQNKGIPIVAYKPLLRGKGVEHPVVVGLGEKYSKTPGSVLLRWGVQKGLALLPKSANPTRMAANLSCCLESNEAGSDGGSGGAAIFSLAEEDMVALDALTTEESHATFDGHFLSRAVVDSTGPTLALGYGPRQAVGEATSQVTRDISSSDVQ
jgi:diketogulonate reductase-like aldo/keto reductase